MSQEQISPLGAIFLSAFPLTWNPGSAPIDLNMYTINVIADDESKIGLYEIYFLND
jgi:archaellin